MKLCFGFTLAIIFIGGACGDGISNEQENGELSNEDFYSTDSPQPDIDQLHWSTGDAVNISIGQTNAVYCEILDPSGTTVYKDFGQCRIDLDRVSIQHEGVWVRQVAYPGSAVLQEIRFNVNVHVRDVQSIVNTTVETVFPSMTLTCSVPHQYEIQACKFRNPYGKLLVAGPHIGHGAEEISEGSFNYMTSVRSNQCILHIAQAVVSDLGIWRCAVQTSTGTHYGFLLAMSHVAMETPEVQESIVTEPVLQGSNVLGFQGEPLVIRCSVNAAIRYCFFRRNTNGSTHIVYPGMPSTGMFGYVGAGFEAGECGIRFMTTSFRDSGFWSCHVGLTNITAPEMTAPVRVRITDKMEVRHFRDQNSNIVVQARLSNEHPLDYCRFLRWDGLGFTTDNLPQGYDVVSELHRGHCTLYMSDWSDINLYPWQVAAKLTGVDGEISMITIENLFWVFGGRPSYSWAYWILIIPAILLIGAMTFACFRKKNRQWVYGKANRVRMSFKRSNTAVAVKPSIAYPVEGKNEKPYIP